MNEIRRARPADRDALYEICRRTADVGGDATPLYDDPELIGHVWVGPYLACEPEHAFVAVAGDVPPVGYVVGALDSNAFEARLEHDWWPDLRRRYPTAHTGGSAADRAAIHLIHHPPRADAAFVADFPSHLHIDLLPDGQGQGLGRQMLDHLLDALAADGSPGVQLGVARANERAVRFYETYGFTRLAEREHAITFGTSLDPVSHET